MKKYARKYALFIIVIVFAITMIIWPLATTQSGDTTQEDPGTADSGFSVSLDFGDVKDVLGKLDYNSVDELIQELDINRDDIPADYQFIYDTYKELLGNINDKLTNLDGVEDISDGDAVPDGDVVSDGDVVPEEDAGLDEDVALLVEAESYLNEGNFDEASTTLTIADHQVETIEDLLTDVDDANTLIINILGSLAPADQREEAKNLRKRLDEDKEWLVQLKAAYEEFAPPSITTGLELIEVPGQIYAGQPYTIRGQISYDDETPSTVRDITLEWDNKELDFTYSSQDPGNFEIEVTPDENTKLGDHTLIVIIKAQDPYGQATVTKDITVTKDLPEIIIKDLTYKLLSRKVEIKGRVSAETDLTNAILVIEIKGKSTRVSPSSDGEFEASLDVPLGLFNLGPKEIKLRLEPSEPWQSTTEITAEIFILDIFSLGFISTAFVAVGMVVFVTKRGRSGKGGSGILEMSPSPEPDLEFMATPLEELKGEFLEGTRGQIAKTYIESLNIVKNATGVSMKPCMTLREFLKETRPKLNGAAESFKELTRLTEDALYCPRIPGSDDLEKAESLSWNIKGTLK